jgi:hypothetical protein
LLIEASDVAPIESICLVAATATAVTTTTAATGTATAAVAAATGTITAAASAARAITAAAVAAAARATTATKAATAAAEAASAGRTGFHRTSFVYDQTTTTKLLAIHGLNGGLRFGIAAHFHKAETLRTASVALHHDFCAGNGTVCGKCLLQIFVTERIRQVAYVKFVAHGGTPENNSKSDGVHNRNQQTSED